MPGNLKLKASLGITGNSLEEKNLFYSAWWLERERFLPAFTPLSNTPYAGYAITSVSLWRLQIVLIMKHMMKRIFKNNVHIVISCQSNASHSRPITVPHLTLN